MGKAWESGHATNMKTWGIVMNKQSHESLEKAYGISSGYSKNVLKYKTT